MVVDPCSTRVRASDRVAEVVAANCDIGVVDRRWDYALLAQGREGGGNEGACRGPDLGVGRHRAILRVEAAIVSGSRRGPWARAVAELLGRNPVLA